MPGGELATQNPVDFLIRLINRRGPEVFRRDSILKQTRVANMERLITKLTSLVRGVGNNENKLNRGGLMRRYETRAARRSDDVDAIRKHDG